VDVAVDLDAARAGEDDVGLLRVGVRVAEGAHRVGGHAVQRDAGALEAEVGADEPRLALGREAEALRLVLGVQERGDGDAGPRRWQEAGAAHGLQLGQLRPALGIEQLHDLRQQRIVVRGLRGGDHHVVVAPALVDDDALGLARHAGDDPGVAPRPALERLADLDEDGGQVVPPAGLGGELDVSGGGGMPA
jgi:hypothetical protein